MVVDGPTRFDVAAQSVLDLADINLLVVQLLVPSVRNTVRIIEGMRDAGYNMERARLVLNRVSKETSHLSVTDVTTTLNLEATIKLAEDWASVGGAINLGTPLLNYAPKSRCRQLIRELAERIDGKDTPQEEKKGLISIFGKR